MPRKVVFHPEPSVTSGSLLYKYMSLIPAGNHNIHEKAESRFRYNIYILHKCILYFFQKKITEAVALKKGF
jgi:hypothetical protein